MKPLKPLEEDPEIDLPANLKVKIREKRPVIKSNGEIKTPKRTNHHHVKKHHPR